MILLPNNNSNNGSSNGGNLGTIAGATANNLGNSNDSSSTSSNFDSNKAKNDKEAINNNKPQRVCDSCNEMLEKKEELKTERAKKEEQKVDLLSMTSMVSHTLMDVFLLDGSFQTLSYDESTTVDDICSR